MNLDEANLLNKINADFYKSVAQSFSKTRECAWKGWDEVLDVAQDALLKNPALLDIGCGNLRFEDFAYGYMKENSTSKLKVHAIDNCVELFEEAHNKGFDLKFYAEDICLMIQGKSTPAFFFSIPECSLSVCFGLMHHIPLEEWRRNLISLLASKTQKGGFICVSFWQFIKNERLSIKAKKATKLGQEKYNITLDSTKGDFFLGWQDSQNAFRYCHSFSDAEIDDLINTASSFGLKVVADYLADGKENNLNRYIIWQVI